MAAKRLKIFISSEQKEFNALRQDFKGKIGNNLRPYKKGT